MKKTLLIPVVIVLVAIFVFGGCASAPAPAPAPGPAPTPAPSQQSFELKFSHPFPEVDEMWQCALKYMFTELENRTGGRAKVTPYFSQSLVKMTDQLDALNSGVADIIFTPPDIFPNVFVISQVNTLPSIRLPNRFVSMQLSWSMMHSGLLDKDFADYKLIFWAATTPMGFGFTKKVTSLEEIRKLKVRTPAGTPNKVVGALGASVVSMPTTEVYMAVDRGTVDGLVTMPGSYFNSKFDEVAPYWLFLPLGVGANVVAMSQKKWDSLPVDIQLIWEELIHETRDVFFDNIEKLPSDLEQFKAKGAEVYYLSPDEEESWYKLMEPVTEEWISAAEAKGYPGREAVKYASQFVSRAMHTGP